MVLIFILDWRRPMHGSISRPLVVLGSVAIALLSLASASGTAGAAKSTPTGATITGGLCQGDTDTLSWSPPYPGVLQYNIAGSGPSFSGSQLLPPTQTSLKFQVSLFVGSFGSQSFTLAADSMTQDFRTFATASTAPFEAPPQPFNWDGSGPDISGTPNMVGDGFVTVAFFYPAFGARSTGNTTDTVTIMASPGGATRTGTISATDGLGAVRTFTFMGLTNGTPYTFASRVTNTCGSSAGTTSAPLTPLGPVTTTTAPATSTTVAPSTLTCFVSGLVAGPPKQQMVTVQSSAGLASITNIQIVNGSVSVAPFTAGTTAPVVVTATKSDETRRTSWQFVATTVNGNIHFCG